MNKDNLKKERRFVLTRKPAKHGHPYPPSVFIPGECEVYDPKTDKQRTAVYLRGARSIWADEIPALEKEKTIHGDKIIIKNGFLSVSPAEKNKLDYLLACGYNEANTDTRINSAVLFRELDIEKQAKKAFEDSKIIDNARYFSSNGDIREVRAYALAWAKNNAEYSQIQRMSEYEVRIYMRQLSEKNPKKFVESMSESVLRNKVKIIHAIYSDVLILNEQDRTLAWKNGDIVVSAPQGLDPVVYFAEMAMDNPKFTRIFNAMLELMGEGKEEPKSEKVERKEAPTKNESDEEELIAELLDKGILTVGKTGLWYRYGEEKWKTKKLLIEALQEDNTLYTELLGKLA